MDQFAQEFGLNVTNASSPETNVDWTFRSSMGVCRRLDFILASQNLLVSASGPSDKLDLGSDHRVVETTMVCQKKVRRNIMRKKPQPKDGAQTWIQMGMQLNIGTHLKKVHTRIRILKKTMYDAATTPSITVGNTSGLKPWRSEKFKT